MSDFLEREKEKIENFNHKISEDIDKHKKKRAEYYKSAESGKVITAAEYNKLVSTEEMGLSLGQNTDGTVNPLPLIEEENLDPKENYFPYFPED